MWIGERNVKEGLSAICLTAKPKSNRMYVLWRCGDVVTFLSYVAQHFCLAWLFRNRTWIATYKLGAGITFVYREVRAWFLYRPLIETRKTGCYSAAVASETPGIIICF